MVDKRQWSGRKVQGTAFLVLLALVLAACGGDGNGEDDGDGAAGDGDPLVYWSMWNPGEPQANVLEAAIEEFQTATGITVEVQWAGREVLSQVATRLNAGDPPDLTDQEGGELSGVLGVIDALQGLGDVYDSQIDGEDVTVGDVIDESYVDEYRTEGGEPFMVPYELIGSTMWFNGADHAGLAERSPLSWDEFVSYLEELRDSGREPIALDGDIRFYENYWFTWAVVRHGGVGLLREAATDETGETLEDPAFLAAAEDLHALIDGELIVSDFKGTQWPAQQTGWATGEYPSDFLLMGSWAPSETAEHAREGFEYESMAFPTVDGGAGNNAAELGAIGFAIPEGARNPDAAKQFITFFLNRDRLEPIASETLNLTPREDIPVPSQLESLQRQIAAAEEFFVPYDGADGVAPDWNSNILEEVVAEFFNGRYGPAEFIEELRSRTVAFYESQ